MACGSPAITSSPTRPAATGAAACPVTPASASCPTPEHHARATRRAASPRLQAPGRRSSRRLLALEPGDDLPARVPAGGRDVGEAERDLLPAGLRLHARRRAADVPGSLGVLPLQHAADPVALGRAAALGLESERAAVPADFLHRAVHRIWRNRVLWIGPADPDADGEQERPDERVAGPLPVESHSARPYARQPACRPEAGTYIPNMTPMSSPF